MEFRPCIDIHNGKVKQIIGGSLTDSTKEVLENFVSIQDAGYYAKLYKKYDIKGGHVILLNPVGSPFYEATKEQAFLALNTFGGGLQVGGGITPQNAKEFLDQGASHVIVTSYVFQNGTVYLERLKEMVRCVGKEKLVLDLSCRKEKDDYRIVTDRWQKVSKETIDYSFLDQLSDYCSEFLVHAVDVEGKSEGIEEELVELLGKWGKIPITYAGGVHVFEDLNQLKTLGQNRLNVTIGSALDLFGGNMALKDVIEYCQE